MVQMKGEQRTISNVVIVPKKDEYSGYASDNDRKSSLLEHNLTSYSGSQTSLGNKKLN